MPKKLINWECRDEYNLESEMNDEILAELEEDSLEDLPEEQLILMSIKLLIKLKQMWFI